MTNKLNVIPIDLLDEYQELVNKDLISLFDQLADAEISTDTFNFYTSVAAIASSRIEGEQLEVDSYLKHKMLDIAYQRDLVQKPDDLYNAYTFAQQHPLTAEQFLQAHQLIAAHLLPPQKQGVLRTGNMVVMEHNTARIQLEAAQAHQVNTLFELLWDDIKQLKKLELACNDVFYFAAFIHLVFVNIHPFEGGERPGGAPAGKMVHRRKVGKKGLVFAK